VTEERKFAILFAATILAARKLIDMDRDKPNMAKGFFVDRAIEDAAFILERIDARWPTIVNSFSAKNRLVSPCPPYKGLRRGVKSRRPPEKRTGTQNPVTTRS